MQLYTGISRSSLFVNRAITKGTGGLKKEAHETVDKIVARSTQLHPGTAWSFDYLAHGIWQLTLHFPAEVAINFLDTEIEDLISQTQPWIKVQVRHLQK